MKVIVTGAAGFLGMRVAQLLASESSPLALKELVLVDTREPPAPYAPSGLIIKCLALDLKRPGAADELLINCCDVLFHLAAAVSGHAEADFDDGFAINFDATRALLEAVRHHAAGAKFVFTSTVGAYGGRLPPIIDDFTATTPQNSYGTAKAMCELLVNEYSRRGFVDGRAVRLPTVVVRAGKANRAVTSFASGIVREPLAGLAAVCPVARSQQLWVCGVRAAVRNVVHAGALPAAALGPGSWRALALPGLRVSVAEMLAALHKVAGAAAVARVRFERDDTIAQMVASFPSQFDVTRALNLGFVADTDFETIIREYIQDDLNKAN